MKLKMGVRLRLIQMGSKKNKWRLRIPEGNEIVSNKPIDPAKHCKSDFSLATGNVMTRSGSNVLGRSVISHVQSARNTSMISSSVVMLSSSAASWAWTRQLATTTCYLLLAYLGQKKKSIIWPFPLYIGRGIFCL